MVAQQEVTTAFPVEAVHRAKVRWDQAEDRYQSLKRAAVDFQPLPPGALDQARRALVDAERVWRQAVRDIPEAVVRGAASYSEVRQLQTELAEIMERIHTGRTVADPRRGLHERRMEIRVRLRELGYEA